MNIDRTASSEGFMRSLAESGGVCMSYIVIRNAVVEMKSQYIKDKFKIYNVKSIK